MYFNFKITNNKIKLKKYNIHLTFLVISSDTWINIIQLNYLGVLMKNISSALLVASSLIVTASIANADQFLRMVSGPSGGSWYPLGAKVMQTMESKIKGVSTSNTCLLYTSPSPRD